VLILGIVAGVSLVNYRKPSQNVKKDACYVTKGEIEVQAQLWFRTKGYWPADDLADIAADAEFFPEGLPVCPVDGAPYVFDPLTGRVTGHGH